MNYSKVGLFESCGQENFELCLNLECLQNQIKLCTCKSVWEFYHCQLFIIESVDSISRDGPDTPIYCTSKNSAQK